MFVSLCTSVWVCVRVNERVGARVRLTYSTSMYLAARVCVCLSVSLSLSLSSAVPLWPGGGGAALDCLRGTDESATPLHPQVLAPTHECSTRCKGGADEGERSRGGGRGRGREAGRGRDAGREGKKLTRCVELLVDGSRARRTHVAHACTYTM